MDDVVERFVNVENMSDTNENNRIVPRLPHLVKSSTLNDFLIFNTSSEGTYCLNLYIKRIKKLLIFVLSNLNMLIANWLTFFKRVYFNLLKRSWHSDALHTFAVVKKLWI